MKVLLAAVALLVPTPTAARAEPPAAGERYTPLDGWQDEWSARFYEGWFSRQLRAMDEPALRDGDDLGRFRSRFRMLVLPNDDPAWMVRIDERGIGDALVTFVELDGAGGYAAGNVERRRRYAIDSEDVAALRYELRRTRFQQLSREAPPPAPMQCNEDECLIQICMHATEYVFERLDERGGHLVERSECDIEPELRQLVQLLSPLRER